MGKKKNYPHILNASSTLLGLCFVVLTSLKLRTNNETSVIDEFTAVAILMFMTSSILSYLSLRSGKKAVQRYEKIADVVFLSGLILLFITTLLITLNIIE